MTYTTPAQTIHSAAGYGAAIRALLKLRDEQLPADAPIEAIEAIEELIEYAATKRDYAFEAAR